MPSFRLFRFIAFTALLVVMGSGCATLQHFAALGNVDFSLDRVSGLRLAGIDLGQIDSYDDIGFSQAASLALAITQKRLPMEFQLHVLAENSAGMLVANEVGAPETFSFFVTMVNDFLS